jgi:inner membrane protein
MPTILTHPVIALATRTFFRPFPMLVVMIGAIFTIVPDLDIVAFGLGIPYAHPLGHRGFSHSILFALILAAAGTFGCTRGMRNTPALIRRERAKSVFLYFFVCTLSHGLLDAMTNGGKGVGFFVPFDNERYFLPFRPIRVSPIGVGNFLERGLPVLVSELIWIWLPSVVIIAIGSLARRRIPNQSA